MSSEEIRERTQKVWDRFYTWGAIWERSACTPTLRARLGFIFSQSFTARCMQALASPPTAPAQKSKRWGALDRTPVQEALPRKAHA